MRKEGMTSRPPYYEHHIRVGLHTYIPTSFFVEFLPEVKGGNN